MTTSIDPNEVAKFKALSQQWWQLDGPLKTLHDLNPARIEFIKRLTPLTHQRVLDLGCGGGILAEGLAREGAVVTGLDVEQEAILVATAHAKEHNHSIQYFCQPVEQFTAEPFDVIVCMEMLEHVADPNLILQHAARLLKPGGYLFLSTINRTLAAYTQAILAAEYLLGLLPRQTHDYDKLIRPSTLARLVRHHHLNVIALSGIRYDPFNRLATLHPNVSVNYLMACQSDSEKHLD